MRLCFWIQSRWHNHLNPTIKKGEWTEDEERIIHERHFLLGNRWAEISKSLIGRWIFYSSFSILNDVLTRSDNAIKNYWNSIIRCKLKGKKKKKRHPFFSSSSINSCYFSSWFNHILLLSSQNKKNCFMGKINTFSYFQ